MGLNHWDLLIFSGLEAICPDPIWMGAREGENTSIPSKDQADDYIDISVA